MKYFVISAVLLASTFSTVTANQRIGGQCGGVNWNGQTLCVAGSTCEVQNKYFSQCVSSPKSSQLLAVAERSAPSTPSFFAGVNTAGYEFNTNTDGTHDGTGVDPPVGQYAHFAAQNVNLFRIPFSWQAMQPTLGGDVDQTYFRRYDASVQAALNSSSSAYVILDLHNYARWNGAIIGQGGPTDAQFANFWTRLSGYYANTPRVMFGLMNEPHDLPNLQTWANTLQAAVNAIRATSANSQFILLPGDGYSSAEALPTAAGPYLAKITDPAGGTSQLLMDVHTYLDSDGSGRSADCVTNKVTALTGLVTWLKSVSRQALLTETGGGSTSSCETNLNQTLAYVKANSQSIVGYAIWAAGSFDTTYNVTVTPNADGSDQPIWTQAVVPNI